MLVQESVKITSGIFITFSGNCKKALTFYQTCFGGRLHFEIFPQKLPGYPEIPVLSGSLISESIIIYGSDLVHNEGRNIGNYLSVFLQCKNAEHRRIIIGKLKSVHKTQSPGNHEEQRLIEIRDVFDVRWVLGI